MEHVEEVRNRLPARFAAGRWALLAGALGVLPFIGGLSTTRVFYARDLSSFFWGRYLWLRHEWFAGHFPLWDPHVGAGQATYSDALNQMFLPPSMLVRLLGNDVVGFNLWVLVPFPIAAIGAWLLFSRRSSPAAATLGAAAFAMCGPIVSTGNFPNMSWSVAMMPWVIWATDRLVGVWRARDIGLVALCVALQCLAGEPVTLFTTCVLALAYAACSEPSEVVSAIGAMFRTGVGILLGAAVASVQLVPMLLAAMHADRSDTITADAWSLRPTALIETVWHHLFGDYYTASSLTTIPWMPLINSGREPMLFSLYLGTPLLAVAVLGLAGRGPRRWRLFWVTAGFCSLILAFGSYTPLYPVLRDHVPPFGTFRFPVKYLTVAMLALAAGVALGFDHLWDVADYRRPCRRYRRSVSLAVLTPLLIVAAVAGAWAGCVMYPVAAGEYLATFAQLLSAQKGGEIAPFMLKAVATTAAPVVILGTVTLALVSIHSAVSGPVLRRAAAGALALLLLGDLYVHAQPINPVFDATYLAPPAWAEFAVSDPNARFYVGGKMDGTLAPLDIDSSRAFLATAGLTAAGSRAALNAQTAYYPSAWGGRELLSYDLPVIWPREHAEMMKQFEVSAKDERDAFLDRTGVRFRILPARRAHDHTPLMRIPLFSESFLYDWGTRITPRVSLVSAAVVVRDPKKQLAALFKPHVRRGEPVVLDRDLPPAGLATSPHEPTARIVNESSSAVDIEATTNAGNAYLLFLDSYSDDWRASVDGQPAPTARAYRVFRALHLKPGTHHIRFAYSPEALRWGAGVTLFGLVMVIVLLALGARRTRYDVDEEFESIDAAA